MGTVSERKNIELPPPVFLQIKNKVHVRMLRAIIKHRRETDWNKLIIYLLVKLAQVMCNVVRRTTGSENTLRRCFKKGFYLFIGIM